MNDKTIGIGTETAVVLRLFLDDPGTPRADWEVARSTGLDVVAVERIMGNLARPGWIKAEPADGNLLASRRYAMPPAGVAAARRQLAEMAAERKRIEDCRADGITWAMTAERLGYNSGAAAQARHQALARALEILPPA